jgi:hypothetical protein
MKTIEEIKKKLENIESDVRLGYKPASVDVNAPLALIQCSLGSMRDMLKWVLDE